MTLFEVMPQFLKVGGAITRPSLGEFFLKEDRNSSVIWIASKPTGWISPYIFTADDFREDDWSVIE